MCSNTPKPGSGLDPSTGCEGDTVAKWLFPSSFECDCGHKSHFFERTIGEMQTDSRRRRTPILLGDSDADEHAIEFENGRATAVICSKLGRCKIEG